MLLRFPPPKPPNIPAYSPKRVTIAATIAKKLATVITRTSRFAMCESSWARTASSSSLSSRCHSPLVTATAACFGLRPGRERVRDVGLNDGNPRLRQVGHRAEPFDHRVEVGRLLGGDDLRAGRGERDLVGGVVLEEGHADDDHDHRREADVEHAEEHDGEDDVEQPEQPAREEHPQRQSSVATERPAFHSRDGTPAT